MKENIEIIKKLWANKRVRSLMILSLYAIFFIVIILSFGNKNEVINTVPKNAMTTFRENKHYSYTLLVNGKATHNVNVFSSEPANLPDNLTFLNNEFIYKLTNIGKLEGTTNNYTEEYKESSYKIIGDKLVTLGIATGDINLIIRENKEKIEKVVINFSTTYNEIDTLELNYKW